MVNGRQLVMEEPLGGDQLALRLDELALGSLDDAACGVGHRADPAATAVNRSDHRFRLLGMRSSSSEEASVDVDQRECRPGDRVRSRPALGFRMRERALRCSRRRYEVAGEIEGVRQARQRGDKHVVGFAFGDLDGTAARLDARRRLLRRR